MSLIHCSSNCLYQHDGYCELEKAAEITNCEKAGGCLHFVPTKSKGTDGKDNQIPKFT